MRHQGLTVILEDSCGFSAALDQGEGLIRLRFHTYKDMLSKVAAHFLSSNISADF